MGIILAWAALHGLMTLLPDSSLLAKDKGLEPYALLLGTCFTGEGFSLPGAKILVEMKAAEIKKDKGKKWQTVSNVRGEFALRLPAGHHAFLINASREGFKPVQKTVSFEQDERQDVILRFEIDPAKKKQFFLIMYTRMKGKRQ